MQSESAKGEASYFLYDNPSSSSSYTSIGYQKGEAPKVATPQKPQEEDSSMGYQQAAAATPFPREAGIIAEDLHKEQTSSPYEYEGELSCNDSLRWIREGWAIYRRHWVTYTMLEVPFFLYTITDEIIDEWAPTWLLVVWAIGFLGVWPLRFGHFILASNYYKKRELLTGGRADAGITVDFQISDFFKGYSLYFPLLFIMLFLFMFSLFGLLLFVFPAIYIYFTLSFAPLVYIEYHKQKSESGHFGEVSSYGVIECLYRSWQALHEAFWEIMFFYFILTLINLLGFITWIGVLVTFPLTSLCVIPAFRDLFGFQLHRRLDGNCDLVFC